MTEGTFETGRTRREGERDRCNTVSLWLRAWLKFHGSACPFCDFTNLSNTPRNTTPWLSRCHSFPRPLSPGRASSLALSPTPRPSARGAVPSPGGLRPLSCIFPTESTRTTINVRVITPASPGLYKLGEGRNGSNLSKSNSTFLSEDKDTNLYAWQIHTRTGALVNLFTICSLEQSTELINIEYPLSKYAPIK